MLQNQFQQLSQSSQNQQFWPNYSNGWGGQQQFGGGMAPPNFLNPNQLENFQQMAFQLGQLQQQLQKELKQSDEEENGFGQGNGNGGKNSSQRWPIGLGNQLRIEPAED